MSYVSKKKESVPKMDDRWKVNVNSVKRMQKSRGLEQTFQTLNHILDENNTSFFFC